MSEAARVITTDDGFTGTLDDKGRLVIPQPDGGSIYRIHWREKREIAANKKHDANLALDIDDARLFEIADELLREIQSDEVSRNEYIQSLANAIEMLGIRLEDPHTAASDSSAPLEGMSTFRHPLLLQSSIRFQADFVAELLPADGPVKIRDDHEEAPPTQPAPPAQPASGQPGLGPVSPGAWMDNQPPGQSVPEMPGLTTADLAQFLTKDLNHYLTTTATEYYPDTTRMAFWVGLMGGGFKKVYHCPIRKRPVSESIDVGDLIVDHSATDLENAARVTHRIKMRKSKLRRMIKMGVYRDIDTGTPIYKQDALEMAVDRATGIMPGMNVIPQDQPHTIYECATERDVEGDDWLPYKITVDKDSRQVLSIYRNWSKDDELKLKRREIVKYSYLDALGFYPLGLVHILGNTVRALTATFREFIDAGQFANFPGFLYSYEAGKQVTNQFRVAPGSGQPINTGGKPIGDVIAPLPYKTPDASFMQFIQHIEESGKSLGGEAAVPLNEGTSNMPVGTMLAQIEQTLKPIKGVFKGLHRSQSTEFQLLKDRFREDPGALTRYNAKPARKWEEAELLIALNDADLVPAADPNTASQVQRIAIAWAMVELAEKAPYLFHERDTALRFLRMIGVPDPEGILATQEEIQQAKAAMSAGKGGGKPSNPQVDAATAHEKEASAGLKEAQTDATRVGMQIEGEASAAAQAEKAGEQHFKAAELLTQAQERDADRQQHVVNAETNKRTAEIKAGADLTQTALKAKHEQQEAERQRAHEAGMAVHDAVHEHIRAAGDREHEAGMAQQDQAHEADQTDQAQQHEAQQTDQAQQHETRQAGFDAANEAEGRKQDAETAVKVAKAKPKPAAAKRPSTRKPK